MGSLVIDIILLILFMVTLLTKVIYIIQFERTKHACERFSSVPTTYDPTPTQTYDLIQTVNIFRPNASKDFGCRDDHVLPLGEREFISVCYYQEEVIVDIRTFLDTSQGLYPTIRGIHLNVQQWKSLKRSQRAVDTFIRKIGQDVNS